MALEEPSVVAAASNASKLTRKNGGFTALSDPPIMIGQIQVVGLSKRGYKKARKLILKDKARLIRIANKVDSTLVKLGGGVRDIDARVIKTPRGRMLIIHLVVDVREAMAPHVERLTGGEALLKIISNLATYRIARAKAVWSREDLGDEATEGILDAYAFAYSDKYRCATHNKGIMNGVDAVAIATGNDFRALEAAAHCYASLEGYKPLTKYALDEEGNLVGTIEIPITVGLVGGATKTHPIARTAVKILGVKTAQELAEVMACVGLANNFAALRAMIKEGIQHGHMKLHAKNIAVIAGAKGKLIERIARKIIAEKNINVARARELLSRFRRGKKNKLRVGMRRSLRA
jgi:hydroxymethylglutaryl-CoA reductase